MGAAQTLDEFGEENLLRPAPLMGGNRKAVIEDLLYHLGQAVVAAAAGVRFVADHHRAPLAVAHGARAAVGQQIDVDVFGAQQEGVPTGDGQRFVAVFGRGLLDRFHHLDAERFGNATGHDVLLAIARRHDGERGTGGR